MNDPMLPPETPGLVPRNEDSVASSSEQHFKRATEDDTPKKEETIEDQHAQMYPMRFTTIPLPGGNEAYLNAVTSFFGFAFLWGLSIWCMVDPAGSYEKLTSWKDDVTRMFTWFYIIANPAFTFFVFWLAIRYGNVKLGKKDEAPEFDDISYFMMLFSAGVAVGLFFYGVSEPLWHQQSHWYAEAGYRSQDEIDQWAMMLTMYHWGFAGWSPYVVVAVATGLAAYRFDLPMTVRSGLYEMLGAYTWGWIGDIIDGFSIVMTVAGVCTSLGLGAAQISTGAKRMGWMEEDTSGDELTDKNVIIIWSITIIATISVVSGLSFGIKLLSQVGFGLGLALLFLVLVMEKTWFLFNLHVQTIGVYFQHCLFQVPFWTDAFGQLEPGEGRNIEGTGAATWWQGSWTVFYMAWWTAWGAFVGLFLARISRGRTIRQVVFYSFFAPLFFSFLWFCTFGGAGLRQARQGMELEKLGEDYYNNSAQFRVDGSDFCYDVPQEDVYVGGTEEPIFINTLKGITPVCQFDATDSTSQWFHVMFSFSYPDSDGFAGFGKFMAGLSMIALTIYFVTSSDSGSLIVDHLASNGHEEHHWLQRVFWAFTEGAVATALLVAGGDDALNALQSASLVFGLPFNFILFAMMYCTVKMCATAERLDAEGDYTAKLPEPDKTSFAMPVFGGVFNIMETIVSIGSVHQDRVARGMDMPAPSQTVEFFVGLFIPPYSIYRILQKLDYGLIATICLTCSYTVFFGVWIAMFASSAINDGFVAFGFLAFFLNGTILSMIRLEVREKYALDGNVVADFLMGSFLYFQVLCQILYQFEVGEVAPPAVPDPTEASGGKGGSEPEDEEVLEEIQA